MPSFEELIKEKSKRLESIPLKMQTAFDKQQKAVLDEISLLINELDIKAGQILINKNNLDLIAKIDTDLKKVFLNEDYLKSVKQFAKEFDKQALINNNLINSGLGEIATTAASESYIALSKRSAVQSLIGAPIDTEFIRPVQSILENAVVNGASLKDTLSDIKIFIEGDSKVNSKLSSYVKQVTNDAFAISDRSYTSIISDALDAEWFYYAGGEVEATRCFCEDRVGNYYHYLEIESWGNGDNLGRCNIGSGTWAGEIEGTNSKTIYSYLGGWNCQHSLMPVSISIVPESDIERARDLGYID